MQKLDHRRLASSSMRLALPLPPPLLLLLLLPELSVRFRHPRHSAAMRCDAEHVS
jgi:hypothetical protein